MLRKKLRRLIVILSVISLTGGVAVSAYAGYQIRASNVAINEDYINEAELNWVRDANSAFALKPVATPGIFLGTISIPTINKVFNIFEGTEEKQLSKGVGHYSGSVLPGVMNNSVLSGHRDTVFANLGKVEIGDLIRIRVRDGVFVYKVWNIRIVDKGDRTVIVPTTDAVLTLTTCYPFRYLGAAPERYIVSAKLITSPE